MLGGGAYTELGPFFSLQVMVGVYFKIQNHEIKITLFYHLFYPLFRSFKSPGFFMTHIFIICTCFSVSMTASNLLFVESPAGVGWSYSNTTSDYNAWDISTGIVHYFKTIFHPLQSQ